MRTRSWLSNLIANKANLRPQPEFCCRGLNELIACAGSRGLAAIVVRRGDGLGFQLQSRGIDFPNIARIQGLSTDANWPPECPLNISSSGGHLQFCPFCGTPIARLIRRYEAFYRQLAKQHAKYANEPS